MKSETKLKNKLFKELRKWKLVYFEKIQQVGKRGTLDVIACLPCKRCGKGLFGALELKTEVGLIDPLQQFKLMQIQEAGGFSSVVRNVEDLERFKDYAEHSNPWLDLFQVLEEGDSVIFVDQLRARNFLKWVLDNYGDGSCKITITKMGIKLTKTGVTISKIGKRI